MLIWPTIYIILKLQYSQLKALDYQPTAGLIFICPQTDENHPASLGVTYDQGVESPAVVHF